MDFQLALTGNLQRTIESRTKAWLTGLRTGTQNSVNESKNKLRRDVVAAGLGRRVSTTFRGDVFPKRGLAYEPSGLIYSKAPHIAASHADGTTLRPKFSRFLAIPISGTPADGLRRRNGETHIEAFWRKFGNDSLRFVRRPNGQYQLVARMRANVAGTRLSALRPTRRKDGTTYTRLDRRVDVPVFTLTRTAQLDRRLSSRKILARTARRHPARVAFAVREAMAASRRETAVNA
jgi:hypothetical protein